MSLYTEPHRKSHDDVINDMGPLHPVPQRTLPSCFHLQADFTICNEQNQQGAPLTKTFSFEFPEKCTKS